MESLLSLGAIVFAIVAFLQTNGSKKRLEDAERSLRNLAGRVDELNSAVGELRRQTIAGAASAAEEAKPAERPAETPRTTAAQKTAAMSPAATKEPEPERWAPPPKPAAPRNLEERLASGWLVWLGAVAIMLAGTFLVRYAIERGLLGPTARVMLGFLLGAALAFAGEWLRRRPLQRAIAAIRNDNVPPALTASGLFVAFASIYAAYALYNLLPPLIAFAGLALVALVGVGLSILQGRFVALMGLLGAFVAPALVAAQNPSPWTLFGYLLVVEAGCLTVARYKSWWWFALATLAGAAIWPFLWMAGGHLNLSDILPIGLYLLVSVVGFFALRRGTPDPEGEEDWLEEIRALSMFEWVVWIAASAIAAVLFIVVGATDYGTTGLVITGLVAALYLYFGRRHAIFDSLPVVAAILVLAVAATMPLPSSVHVLAHRPPLVPFELQFYVGACAVYGALFAIAGFVALWGAKRPALWGAVSAAVPILLLTIAYYRIVDFGVDYAWAGIAVALSAACLFAASRVEQYRSARGLEVTLGFYAAGVVALISLAAAMTVREAWLTVALSIQLPALAWIAMRINARAIETIAGILACAVLTRLILNYDVLAYPLSASPLTSWVVYGYGVPAVAFLSAAKLFRKSNARVVMLLDAGGLAFCVLLLSLEIRLFVTGSLTSFHYGLLEQSLQSIAWLSVGSALALHFRQSNRPVSFYGAGILLGVAAAQIALLQLLASNPLWSGESVGAYPVVNILFLAYAIPAIFAFLLSAAVSRTNQARLAPAADIAGFVLVFVYLSLEVTRAFEGPIFHWQLHTNAELYTYSVVWLCYAVALLGLGILFEKPLFRFVSLAALVVTAVKVFLVDMSGLSDLYRVASFLGLGLSLVGIGYIYQRFVFPSLATAAKED